MLADQWINAYNLLASIRQQLLDQSTTLYNEHWRSAEARDAFMRVGPGETLAYLDEWMDAASNNVSALRAMVTIAENSREQMRHMWNRYKDAIAAAEDISVGDWFRSARHASWWFGSWDGSDGTREEAIQQVNDARAQFNREAQGLAERVGDEYMTYFGTISSGHGPLFYEMDAVLNAPGHEPPPRLGNLPTMSTAPGALPPLAPTVLPVPVAPPASGAPPRLIGRLAPAAPPARPGGVPAPAGALPPLPGAVPPMPGGAAAPASAGAPAAPPGASGLGSARELTSPPGPGLRDGVIQGRGRRHCHPGRRPIRRTAGRARATRCSRAGHARTAARKDHWSYAWRVARFTDLAPRGAADERTAPGRGRGCLCPPADEHRATRAQRAEAGPTPVVAIGPTGGRGSARHAGPRAAERRATGAAPADDRRHPAGPADTRGKSGARAGRPGDRQTTNPRWRLAGCGRRTRRRDRAGARRARHTTSRHAGVQTGGSAQATSRPAREGHAGQAGPRHGSTRVGRAASSPGRRRAGWASRHAGDAAGRPPGRGREDRHRRGCVRRGDARRRRGRQAAKGQGIPAGAAPGDQRRLTALTLPRRADRPARACAGRRGRASGPARAAGRTAPCACPRAAGGPRGRCRSSGRARIWPNHSSSASSRPGAEHVVVVARDPVGDERPVRSGV